MPATSAPLKNWEHERSFDSAEQCQVALADLAKEAGPTLRSDHGLTLERAMASADFASRWHRVRRPTPEVNRPGACEPSYRGPGAARWGGLDER
jgi:hypothetical protein